MERTADISKTSIRAGETPQRIRDRASCQPRGNGDIAQFFRCGFVRICNSLKLSDRKPRLRRTIYATEAMMRPMRARSMARLLWLQAFSLECSVVLSTMKFHGMTGYGILQSDRKGNLVHSASEKRRWVLEGIFSKTSSLSPSFQISNA